MKNFLEIGAAGNNMTGVDIYPTRLQNTRNLLLRARWTGADAARLPFPGKHFDLIMQWTVFSSFSDDETWRGAALEMKRVLKPGGTILWDDFWINSANPKVCPMTKARTRELFSGWKLRFRQLTLAPPLARALYPFIPGLCSVLENCGCLNTHHLVQIEPSSEEVGLNG